MRATATSAYLNRPCRTLKDAKADIEDSRKSLASAYADVLNRRGRKELVMDNQTECEMLEHAACSALDALCEKGAWIIVAHIIRQYLVRLPEDWRDAA